LAKIAVELLPAEREHTHTQTRLTNETNEKRNFHFIKFRPATKLKWPVCTRARSLSINTYRPISHLYMWCPIHDVYRVISTPARVAVFSPSSAPLPPARKAILGRSASA